VQLGAQEAFGFGVPASVRLHLPASGVAGPRGWRSHARRARRDPSALGGVGNAEVGEFLKGLGPRDVLVEDEPV
jgi:hypothetical protein